MGAEDRNSGLGKRSDVISVLRSPSRPPEVTDALSLGLLGGSNSLGRGEKGRGEHRRTF